MTIIQHARTAVPPFSPQLRALGLKLMPPAPRQRFDETRVVSVARQLGSVRLLRGLTDAEQKALDRWLKKMSPLLAERLKELE